ncbi:retron Ec78 anti-phage system effector HNH endonuclease PtuB [Xenorhabdus entomophaga]|uniref:retron Ec78 anti-phage system effector HNH endonuclease PtuB n=1 Tax=Xenorhabdus entomophaga TaxID=3136257 RepID=UPI0030F3B66A
MKKLKRPEAPECLVNFKHGKDSWGAVPKDEIWSQLELMQGRFCAYCECELKDRRHIEHFRTRESYPMETFNWNNLFGSCGDTQKKGGWQRCGIYKDSNNIRKYDINKLIKPDEEDPSIYLLFLTSGQVVPQAGLNESQRQKAKETIRVFNLNNNTSLFHRRKCAIESYKDEIDMLYGCLDEFDKDFWNKLYEDNLKGVEGEEFQTALEHAWKYNQDY